MYWLIFVLNTLKNKFCFNPYEDLKFQSAKALNNLKNYLNNNVNYFLCIKLEMCDISLRFFN